MKTWVIILIGCLLILVVLLFTSLKLKIYKRHDALVEVDLYIYFFFRIHIDIDEIYNKNFKGNSIIKNIKTTISYIRNFLDNHRLLGKYAKKMIVKKVTFIPLWNSENPLFAPYITYLNWQLVALFKYLVDDTFKRVDKEYYQVGLENEKLQGLNFDIELKIKVIDIIITSLQNFRQVINVIKRKLKKPKEETYGKTN